MHGNPQDSSSPQATVLDDSVIAMLRELGGDDEPDLLEELVEVFLADAPGRIRDMRAAIDRGDLELLERAAHTLKSSAANLGALVLSEHARQLETAVRAGASVPLDELAAHCQAALDDAERALRGLLE